MNRLKLENGDMIQFVGYDKASNETWINQNGEIYEAFMVNDGLKGLDFLKKIFGKKEGGSKVGNFLDNVFVEKEEGSGSKAGNFLRNIASNIGSGGQTLYPGSDPIRPDNSRLLIGAGLFSVAIITVAVIASKKKKK